MGELGEILHDQVRADAIARQICKRGLEDVHSVRAWGTRRASAGPDSWLALATTVLAGSSDTCAGTQHQRGQAVCVNGLEAPMDITDHAVLGSIERDLLRPEVVERAIEFAIDELRPGTDATRRAELLAE